MVMRDFMRGCRKNIGSKNHWNFFKSPENHWNFFENHWNFFNPKNCWFFFLIFSKKNFVAYDTFFFKKIVGLFKIFFKNPKTDSSQTFGPTEKKLFKHWFQFFFFYSVQKADYSLFLDLLDFEKKLSIFFFL